MKQCAWGPMTLAAVTVVALGAAILGPSVIRHMHQGDRIPAARAQVNAFMTALGAYKIDTGDYPTAEQGLAALRTRPESVEGWNGPYLPREVPGDPWGRPYIYAYSGKPGAEPVIYVERRQ